MYRARTHIRMTEGWSNCYTAGETQTVGYMEESDRTASHTISYCRQLTVIQTAWYRQADSLQIDTHTKQARLTNEQRIRQLVDYPLIEAYIQQARLLDIKTKNYMLQRTS